MDSEEPGATPADPENPAATPPDSGQPVATPLDSHEAGAAPGEPAPAPAPARSSAKMVLFLVLALVLVIAGFLLFSRRGAPGKAAPPAASTPQAASSPKPGSLVVGAPVNLSPQAILVADRYRCLCGQCQDTLGKCTCTRDKGSNDMKAALNKIVALKKTLAEIDAAMVQNFGPGVLVSNPPSPPPAPK